MAEKPPGPIKNWWRKRRSGFWKNWLDFAADMLERVYEPFGQPAFIFYFLGIIVVVGGLGVTISIYEAVVSGTLRATHSVPRSLSTYLLAILATAFVDLTLTVETQSKRSLKMFTLFTLVLGTVGGTIALLTLNVKLAYICALIGTFIALFLWWIANSKNVKLFEPNPPP